VRKKSHSNDSQILLHILGGLRPIDSHVRERLSMIHSPENRPGEEVWIVNLELTNRCNLECVFCDHPVWKTKFVLKDMPDDLLARILSSCKDMARGKRLYELGLVGLGEPTMNRSIERHLKMIDEYADVFERITLNSNLVSLKEKQAHILLGSKINAYTFSVNASDRGVYEKMMQVDVFHRVIDNLRNFLRLVRDKYPKPRVDVQLFDSDENSMDTLKGLLPEAQGLDINFFTRKVYSKPIIPDNGFLNIHNPGGKERYPCWDIYSRVYVDVEGFVYPCTIGNDVYREPSHLCLGNVKSESIENLFNGARNQAARMRAEKGELPFPECQFCNIWSLTPNNFEWDGANAVWRKKTEQIRAYGLKG
jgi:radical SAM protein with 4Fe4S-binding SPASM domain